MTRFINCKYCGKSIEVTECHLKKGRKYCSPECYRLDHAPKISKNKLSELYWVELLSINKISEKLGYPPATIQFWLNKYGIPTRGKKKVELKCDYCGKRYYVPNCRTKRKFKHNFCSLKCYGLHKQKRTEFKCKVCGKIFERTPVLIERGVILFCSKKCSSIYHSGENNPNWKGGWEPYYGPNWASQRIKTLKRDGHTCAICNNSDKLNVHHIKPFRLFGRDNYLAANDLINLITLCVSCHRKVETGAINYG